MHARRGAAGAGLPRQKLPKSIGKACKTDAGIKTGFDTRIPFRRPGPLRRAPGAASAAPPPSGRRPWETLKNVGKTLCFRNLRRGTPGRAIAWRGIDEHSADTPGFLRKTKNSKIDGFGWMASYVKLKILKKSRKPYKKGQNDGNSRK